MDMRQAKQVTQVAGNFLRPIFTRSAIFSFEEQSRTVSIEPPKLGFSTQRFDIVSVFEVHAENGKWSCVGHVTPAVMASRAWTLNSSLSSFGSRDLSGSLRVARVWEWCR
jgi:hypothetical protein